jgi:hypothetical protein
MLAQDQKLLLTTKISRLQTKISFITLAPGFNDIKLFSSSLMSKRLNKRECLSLGESFKHDPIFSNKARRLRYEWLPTFLQVLTRMERCARDKHLRLFILPRK